MLVDQGHICVEKCLFIHAGTAYISKRDDKTCNIAYTKLQEVDSQWKCPLPPWNKCKSITLEI